ncbi:MAG: ABC transporter permease, partial [Paludibacter sp.]|nr:ABC transporter permease [Paludibacter sp.]
MAGDFSKIKYKARGYSFALRVAFRYVFSPKSHNIINIISGISAIGVAIGTAALVIVMSCFNGFEGLIGDMFSAFDPDIRITALKGKYFEINDSLLAVKNLEQVAVFTEIVEENALLRFADRQLPAVIKGVSDNFAQLTGIDSIIYDGKFEVFDGAFERAVLGIGVAEHLGMGAQFIDPLYIYAPKRNEKINLLRPDRSMNYSALYASGIFATNQADYDERFVLVSLPLARELFEYDSLQVTAVEVKVANSANVEKVKKQIKNLLGSNYLVKNRYEQQEVFFRLLKMEKWFAFFILSFILLIASFNVIGSLSMLIIDKRADIQTLRSLGANSRLIRQIFLFEGWIVSAIGGVLGIVIGTCLCLVQQYFKIVTLGAGYIIDAYPVITHFSDIASIFATVLLMGFLAAWYPVK